MKITTRFWISLILSLPMLIEMVLMPFTHWMLPGGQVTMLVLTTIVMLISARPFLSSAWASFQKYPYWNDAFEMMPDRKSVV